MTILKFNEFIHRNDVKESIKPLPDSVSGLIVFDIDDTLLRVDTDTIRIYKTVPGGEEVALTTDELAKDPDIQDHKEWFDFRDFRNEEKVYNSIIEGTPLIKNLRIMDSYIQAGYHFCFLTARGCEETIKNAIRDFLRYRDDNGNLQELEDIFKETLSHAVNDDYKHYPGHNDAEKKANVLRDLCEKYDRVIFVDDDKKNVQYARSLQLDNLKVIQAWPAE